MAAVAAATATAMVARSRSDAATDASPAADEAEPVFRLPQWMLPVVVDHLRAVLPNEGCGLIAVAPDERDPTVASRFFPGTNADQSPSRYTMDPGEVVQAFKTMRELGLELAAIVHSHPANEARPSATDLREAYYPDALMMIVSFEADTPDIRVWKLDRDGKQSEPREVRIEIVE